MQDAPKVLVLQLKRFEYSVYSRHKVTKKVDYQTTLDLAPFTSKPGAGRLVRPLAVHRTRHAWRPQASCMTFIGLASTICRACACCEIGVAT